MFLLLVYFSDLFLLALLYLSILVIPFSIYALWFLFYVLSITFRRLRVIGVTKFFALGHFIPYLNYLVLLLLTLAPGKMKDSVSGNLSKSPEELTRVDGDVIKIQHPNI